MKILITSGSSYVGKYLVSFLMRCGHNVLSTWNDTHSEEIAEHSTKVNFLLPTLCDLQRIIDFHPEVIIVCTGAFTEVENKLTLINTSAALIASIAARSCNASKVIHLSSLSVYGWPLPENIDSALPKPTDEYGRSKLLQEECLLCLDEQIYRVINIRLPVVLGVGAHRAWLPRVKELMKTNSDVTFSNANSFYTCFTTLASLSNFISRLINSSDWRHLSVPLGGRSSITLMKMLEVMRYRLGSKSALIEVCSGIKTAELRSTQAITIGYEPPDILEGLEEFLS